MAAAEPIPEQIAAALKTSLEGITGATYHYPPSAVIRSSSFGEHCLDSSVGDPAVIYVIIPDMVQFTEQTFSQTAGRLELDLVLCRKFEASENPFDPPAASRWQIQQRLLHDVQTKLRADLKLGGLVEHLEIPLADLGAEETFEETWALVFVRVETQFSFTDADP